MNFYRTSTVFLIVIVTLIGLGCSTSQKTTKDRDFAADTASVITENMSDLQRLLAENRSQLSDLHTTQKHDMPAAFMKEDSSSEAFNNNPYDGYRIQIISTREVQVADSVANQFRAWADTTIKGYMAKAYTFFRQPFYKVHVGDFQQRDQANSFSKLIRRQYPDAWVVHDRINPSNVPADTASFSFITSSDRERK